MKKLLILDIFFVCLALGVLANCGLPDGKIVIRFLAKARLPVASDFVKFPEQRFSRVIPPTVSGDMDCYLVNISGTGVSTPRFDLVAPYAASINLDCLAIGVVSAPVTEAQISGGGVSISVEAGNNRRVQILGVIADGSAGSSDCPGVTLDSIFAQGSTDAIYQVGSLQVDLLDATSVTIPDSYLGVSSPEFGQNCLLAKNLAPSHILAGATDSAGSTFVESTKPPSHPTEEPVSGPPLLPVLNLSAITTGAAFFSNQANVELQPHHARVDILFDVSSFDLNDYVSIILNAKVGGGLDSTAWNGTTTCSPASGTSGSGFKVSLFDGKSGNWEPRDSHSPLVQDITYTQSGNSAFSVNHSNSSHFPATGNFVHASFRSIDNSSGGSSGSPCAVINLESVSLQLVPPPTR